MLKLSVIGRLGRDAQIKEFNGKKVIDFSVAVSQRTKNQPEKTIWINCSYWTDFTNVAQYLRKGTQIYTEGVPEISIYNQDSGQMIPTISWRMRINMLELLGSKNDSLNQTDAGATFSSSLNDEKPSQPLQSSDPVSTTDSSADDDLPF